MPALNDSFPWLAHAGNYKFFEDKMDCHSQVLKLGNIGQGLYEITLTDRILRVFICECYSFSIAEYEEVVQNLGPVDVIIINSIWCGYTTDAKFHCRNKRIGLFDIRDFMASLNRPDFWLYLDKSDTERYTKQGLL